MYFSSVTLDPAVGGDESGARILECAGMTALWNDATCRVGGKRRHVAAVHVLLAIKIGFKLGSFSFFEKVKIGEIVNV
jgi:hypothetical protein